jgi:hypothetical protein
VTVFSKGDTEKSLVRGKLFQKQTPGEFQSSG